MMGVPVEVDEIRSETDVSVLWDLLAVARTDGDTRRVRAIEHRMRELGDVGRAVREQQREVSDQRRRRREVRVTLVATVGAFVVVFLAVMPFYGTRWLTWVIAGGAALLAAVSTLIGVSPIRPYHPDAAREDRGFNYFRGWR